MKKIMGICIVMTLSQTATATDIKLKVETGYDSNPFRFSKIYDIDAASFIRTSARLKQPLLDKKAYIKANFNNTIYESNAEDADQSKGQVVVGYLNSVKLTDRNFLYRLEGKYTQVDKTYVSRLSGAVASFKSQSLANRYDYQQSEFKGKLSTRVYRNVKSSITYNYQQRDYEIFSITGLSNLDFSAYQITNGWKYKINKRSNITTDFSFSRRDYKNRIAKDRAGNNLDNSKLAYDYYSFAVNYKFHPARYTDVGLSYDYSYREDNHGGYYNNRNQLAKVDAEYRLFKWAYFESQISYKNTDYFQDPDPEDVANNEELTSKEGYSLKLSYRHSLRKMTGHKLYAGASLHIDDISSDHKFYQYDRQRISINLKGEF